LTEQQFESLLVVIASVSLIGSPDFDKRPTAIENYETVYKIFKLAGSVFWAGSSQWLREFQPL
jgi:hypothetical protein